MRGFSKLGEGPTTIQVAYKGDKQMADKLRLINGYRVMQEFERLTYFQRLMQNERTIRFDDGSWIHLRTCFGDKFATFYVPVGKYAEQESQVEPLYIPFFRAYLEDATPVWVLCRGGLNFGPPYEVLPDAFERNEWSRIYTAPIDGKPAQLTILPQKNPLVTNYVDDGMRNVSVSYPTVNELEVPDGSPYERIVQREEVYVNDDVLFTRPLDYDTPTAIEALICDVANGSTSPLRWGYTWWKTYGIYADGTWEPGGTVGSQQDQWGHRLGQHIGAASDENAYDNGAVFTSVAYPDATIEAVALNVVHGGISLLSENFYGTYGLGASLQEEDFFCWAAIGAVDPYAQTKTYRMGICQGGLVSDTTLPVGESDRKFTAADGTELFYPEHSYLSSGYFSYNPIDGTDAFEPMFGILKADFLQG